jgi:hypothetical protein
MWYRIIYLALLFATTSFVWFYQYPLGSDISLHIAIAKAYADYLATGTPASPPVYQPYLSISSYELPELLLVPFIWVFGIDTAWKVAFSLYAFLFPISISFLVGKINPASRWSRLVGFPFTLNYFFHWGFWPFLVSLLLAVVTMAVSIGDPPPLAGRDASARRTRFLATETVLRLLVFLCHPVPALSVGLFDLARVFTNKAVARKNPALPVRELGYLFVLWLPSFAIALLMMGNEVDKSKFEWVSLYSQAVQIFRPFYLTRQWYEFVGPLLVAAILTGRCFSKLVERPDRKYILVAAVLLIGVGVAMPRAAFINSWENGARVTFLGFILLIAAWSLIEQKAKVLLLTWIFLGSLINISGSHRLWRLHEPSFAWAFKLLSDKFSGYRITDTGAWTGDHSVALGNNLAVWAWCKGVAADAKNAAGRRKTGPAIYVGLQGEPRLATKAVILHYHAYRRPRDLLENQDDRILYYDANNIYTIEDRFTRADLSAPLKTQANPPG